MVSGIGGEYCKCVMDGRCKRRRLKRAVAWYINHRKTLTCSFRQERDEFCRLRGAGCLPNIKAEWGHFDLVYPASLLLCIQIYCGFTESTLFWSKHRPQIERSANRELGNVPLVACAVAEAKGCIQENRRASKSLLGCFG